MKEFKELAKTHEYWLEKIQNDFFRLAADYMDKYDLNQTELAEKLGVSKGYISQILNGNSNFSIKKLVDISLALEAAPNLEFEDISVYAKQEEAKQKFSQSFRSTPITIKAPINAYYNGEASDVYYRGRATMTVNYKMSA